MNPLKRYLQNCAKPEANGFGRLVLKGMNSGHRKLHSWILENVEIPESGTVLDVGCGGGALIKSVLSRNDSIKAVGVDISEESVKMVSSISERVETCCCDIRQIPYPDNTFSLALSAESIYFWNDIPSCLLAVKRVLKEGSVFALAVESADKKKGGIWMKRIPGMMIYSPTDLKVFFAEAGFQHVEVIRRKDWCLVKGMK